MGMFMKKRLLLVTHGYPFGETERSFLSEEVKLLTDRFEVLVMALDNRDQLIYPTDGITHIERYRYSSFRKSRQLRALPAMLQPETLKEVWRFAKSSGFSDPVRKLRRILYYRFNVWEMEQQIGRLVQSENVDIVYTYWCNECTVAAVKLKKRFPNLKVVTRFHGMDLYQERAMDGWQPFRYEVARKADALCFACEYGRTYFRKQWGTEHAKKMHVFYLGSTDRGVIAALPAEKLRLVSCAYLVPLKRVDMIIEALALLPDTVQIEWNHFGDGAEREKMETLAKEKLQSHPDIGWTFHGFVPNHALTEQYRKIGPDVFLTTSSTEGGAPVSIQEVFSMGIPAIGTPVGGIPDLIIDGQTGFLLPQQAEPSDVANAIMKYAVLADEQKKQMSEAARLLWQDKFDAKKNAARFAAFLQNLISE